MAVTTNYVCVCLAMTCQAARGFETGATTVTHKITVTVNQEMFNDVVTTGELLVTKVTDVEFLFLNTLNGTSVEFYLMFNYVRMTDDTAGIIKQTRTGGVNLIYFICWKGSIAVCKERETGSRKTRERE